MKSTTMLRIFVFYWMLDITLTYFALNIVGGGLYEGNPLSRYLFQFGFWGWLGKGLFDVTSLAVVSFTTVKLSKDFKFKYLPLVIFLIYTGIYVGVVTNNLVHLLL